MQDIKNLVIQGLTTNSVNNRNNQSVLGTLYLNKMQEFSLDELLLLSAILYATTGLSIEDKLYDTILESLPQANFIKKYLAEDLAEPDESIIIDLKLKGIRYEEVKILADKLYQDLNIKPFEGGGVYKDYSEFTEQEKRLMDSFPSPQSIKAYRTNEEFLTEVLQDFCNKGIYEAIISYKYDGWNCTSYILPSTNQAYLAHNRSRKVGKLLDLTWLINRIINLKNTDTLDTVIKVAGELIIEKPARDKINKYIEEHPWEYPHTFVTSRSMTLAVVNQRLSPDLINRILFPQELKDVIHYKVFEVSKLDKPRMSMVEQLTLAEHLGFETIKLVRANSDQWIPAIEFLKSNITEHKEQDATIFDIDGLVMCPVSAEDIDKLIDKDGMYSTFRKAYKADIFSKELYQSEITNFIRSRGGSRYIRMIAKIKPIKTKRGYVGEVPLSPKQIIYDKLDIGSVIEFSDRGDIAVTYERRIR